MAFRVALKEKFGLKGGAEEEKEAVEEGGLATASVEALASCVCC